MRPYPMRFYGYLNPESTKTIKEPSSLTVMFYGYLNPESTKTVLSSDYPA